MIVSFANDVILTIEQKFFPLWIVFLNFFLNFWFFLLDFTIEKEKLQFLVFEETLGINILKLFNGALSALLWRQDDKGDIIVWKASK